MTDVLERICLQANQEHGRRRMAEPCYGSDISKLI
jgi:hypothetical protein